ASFTLNVSSPATLSGTKTVSGTFNVGNTITYTVILSNSGPATQLDNPGNEFSDVLPTGLTLVSANATSGTPVATVDTNTVTWNGSIASGGSVTITINAKINNGQAGQTITNQGVINFDADGNGTNEASTLTDDPNVAGSLNPTSFTVPEAATTTAVSATPNPSNSGQGVTFTATVTSAAGTPTGTVQFKDGGTNLGSPQTLNGSGVATFSTTALTPGVHTITADYSGDVNFLTSSGTLSGGQVVGSIIRFSSSTYNTTENSGFTTITVQRAGDLSQAVTADYSTPDDSSALTVLSCSTANGAASPRCDFTNALGTLRWAAGDSTSRTFTVLINQDNFVEGPETLTLTLSNLTAGAGFETPGATSATATLTIADDVT